MNIRKLSVVSLLVMLIIFETGLAAAKQPPPDTPEEAQRKLLARRAGHINAMEKLAKRIHELKINSKRIVGDFVASSDTISAAMDVWLMEMTEDGKPKYFDDGTCEVIMSVSLPDIESKLTDLYQAYYKGDKIKVSAFKKMKEANPSDKIVETGSGVAPESLMEDKLIAANTPGDDSNKLIPPIWQRHCSLRGRLMAVRAARIDAKQRLAERIKTLQITPEISVVDLAGKADETQTFAATFLKGVRELGVRYHSNDLIVEVEIEATLKTVLASLKSWADSHYKGDKAHIQTLQEYVENVRNDMIAETGFGVAPAKYLKDVSPAEMKILQMVSDGGIPAWASDTMQAFGNAGVAADSDNPDLTRQIAVRAAELDARRRLIEQLANLEVSDNTRVADFIARDNMNKNFRTQMMIYQMAAKMVDGSDKILDDGTAQAIVEIDLKPLWNLIVFHMKQYPAK